MDAASSTSSLPYQARYKHLGHCGDVIYNKKKKLGQGQFGVVYKGVRTTTGEPVAIKVFRSTTGVNELPHAANETTRGDACRTDEEDANIDVTHPTEQMHGCRSRQNSMNCDVVHRPKRCPWRVAVPPEIETLCSLRTFRCPNILYVYNAWVKREHRTPTTAPSCCSGHVSEASGARIYGLVSEFCAGGDLQHCLQTKAYVSEAAARSLTYQIANALLFMKSRNIIHRDIKPANILLTSDNLEKAVVKIADFGMAKMVTMAPRRLAKTATIVSPMAAVSESIVAEVKDGPRYAAKRTAKGTPSDHYHLRESPTSAGTMDLVHRDERKSANSSSNSSSSSIGRDTDDDARAREGEDNADCSLRASRTRNAGVHVSPSALFDSELGTPMYMSPERIAQHAYGYKADVYSTGMVLYELMTCSQVRATLPAQLPSAVAAAMQTLMHRHAPEQPAWLDLLMRMTEPDATRRVCVEEVLRHRWFDSSMGPPLPPLTIPIPSETSIAACSASVELTVPQLSLSPLQLPQGAMGCEHHTTSHSSPPQSPIHLRDTATKEALHTKDDAYSNHSCVGDRTRNTKTTSDSTGPNYLMARSQQSSTRQSSTTPLRVSTETTMSEDGVNGKNGIAQQVLGQSVREHSHTRSTHGVADIREECTTAVFVHDDHDKNETCLTSTHPLRFNSVETIDEQKSPALRQFRDDTMDVSQSHKSSVIQEDNDNGPDVRNTAHDPHSAMTTTRWWAVLAVHLSALTPSAVAVARRRRTTPSDTTASIRDRSTSHHPALPYRSRSTAQIYDSELDAVCGGDVACEDGSCGITVTQTHSTRELTAASDSAAARSTAFCTPVTRHSDEDGTAVVVTATATTLNGSKADSENANGSGVQMAEMHESFLSPYTHLPRVCGPYIITYAVQVYMNCIVDLLNCNQNICGNCNNSRSSKSRNCNDTNNSTLETHLDGAAVANEKQTCESTRVDVENVCDSDDEECVRVSSLRNLALVRYLQDLLHQGYTLFVQDVDEITAASVGHDSGSLTPTAAVTASQVVLVDSDEVHKQLRETCSSHWDRHSRYDVTHDRTDIECTVSAHRPHRACPLSVKHDYLALRQVWTRLHHTLRTLERYTARRLHPRLHHELLGMRQQALHSVTSNTITAAASCDEKVTAAAHEKEMSRTSAHDETVRSVATTAQVVRRIARRCHSEKRVKHETEKRRSHLHSSSLPSCQSQHIHHDCESGDSSARGCGDTGNKHTFARTNQRRHAHRLLPLSAEKPAEAIVDGDDDDAATLAAAAEAVVHTPEYMCKPQETTPNTHVLQAEVMLYDWAKSYMRRGALHELTDRMTNTDALEKTMCVYERAVMLLRVLRGHVVLTASEVGLNCTQAATPAPKLQSNAVTYGSTATPARAITSSITSTTTTVFQTGGDAGTVGVPAGTPTPHTTAGLNARSSTTMRETNFLRCSATENQAATTHLPDDCSCDAAPNRTESGPHMGVSAPTQRRVELLAESTDLTMHDGAVYLLHLPLLSTLGTRDTQMIDVMLDLVTRRLRVLHDRKREREQATTTSATPAMTQSLETKYIGA